MNPKEKALDLMLKFYHKVTGIDPDSIYNGVNFSVPDTNITIAKRCAVLAIDEAIIKVALVNEWNYWQEVKQEILNT